MDLNTVEEVTAPRHLDELPPLRDGDAILAGGTWLFSEPQPHVRRLVDITMLGWTPVIMGDNGIQFAATCRISEVARLSATLLDSHPDWTAAPLLQQCCTALLASSKIWGTATIGGNICLSFPAGSMISLTCALDGELTVWRAGGAVDRVPASEFVTGSARNVLAAGDLLRSIHLPARALRARTAFRKIATSRLGRSAAVIIARRDDVADGGRFALSVTAATVRPYVFEFEEVPDADAIAEAHATIPDDAWTRDVHGDPDWRRGVTLVLARQVCAELTCT